MIPQGVEALLERVRRRHAQSSIATSVFWALTWAVGIATAVRTLAHLLWHQPSWLVSAALFALSATLVAWLLRPQPLSRIQAARLIDDRLKLKDRLATAVECQQTDSPILYWLLKDAEQQAQFVDPREVAPFPPRWERKEWIAAGLTVLCIILWSASLPTGLLRTTESTPSATSSLVTAEADILGRIDAIRERAASTQSPQMSSVDREAEAIQAGLRDRSLRIDEANALLGHLERRLSAAEERAGLAPTYTQPQEPIDLERLRDLSKGLNTAQGELRTIRIAAERVTLEPLEPQDEVDPSALSQAQAVASMNAQERSDGAEIDKGGGDAQGEGTEQTEVANQPGAGTNSSTHDEETSGDAGGAASTDGTESEGNGSQPSQQDGRDDFEEAALSRRPGGIRVVVGLSGARGDGPLRAASVPTSVPPPEHHVTVVEPPLAAPTSGTAASAVLRESIPLEYREVVRRYFQSLEAAP